MPDSQNWYWSDALNKWVRVSQSSPMPVAGSLVAANLKVDPFTNATGLNIVPATVRSSATDAFKACKITIHFAAPTSNPVTIALDAHQGAAYDTVLRTIVMGASQDLVYYFPDNAKFEAGDVITVAWTNDIGAVAWAVEITWEE